MFKRLLKHHTPLEKQLEKTAAVLIESLHAPIREIHDPYQCPAELLPWLAWERSVDYWRDDWSEQVKRDVIAASVSVHRKKGTLSAVKQAIAVTGLVAEVTVPKHRADYVPHSFRISLDAEITAPTPSNAKELRYQVDHVKPARCAYDLDFNASAEVHHVSAMGLHSVGQEDKAIHYLNHNEPAIVSNTPSLHLHNKGEESSSATYLNHQAAATATSQHNLSLFMTLREAA